MSETEIIVMNRPIYEALDASGLPYEREAVVVGELPTPRDRLKALETATGRLATALGMKARRTISLAVPVHVAFGMTRAQAKHHSESDLLLKTGEDLTLDLVDGGSVPGSLQP